MNLPALVLVTADSIATANAVFGNLTSGPRQITARLSDQPNPDENATPTHYYMMDMSALDTDVANWQAMTAGDMPQINGAWGVDGVPAGDAAKAAFTGGKLKVFSAAGIDTAQPFVDGVLLGEGLHKVPDPL